MYIGSTWFQHWSVLHLRALLCISHGVTEHMGRYDQLAQLLAENGIFVFGHDHGKKAAVYIC